MAEVIIEETADIENMLEKLPIELRGKSLPRAVGKGGLVVKRAMVRLAPRGDLNHKPDKKPLHKTIAVKNKNYRDGEINMVIVGAQYPAGAHSHLVDQDHEVKVSRGPRKGQAPLSGSATVPGKQYVAAAIDTTTDEVEKAVIGSIVKDIKELGG